MRCISTFYRSAQQQRRRCSIPPERLLNLSGHGTQSRAEYSSNPEKSLKNEAATDPAPPGLQQPGWSTFFEHLLPNGIVFLSVLRLGGLIFFKRRWSNFFKHWPTFFLTFAHAHLGSENYRVGMSKFRHPGTAFSICYIFCLRCLFWAADSRITSAAKHTSTRTMYIVRSILSPVCGASGSVDSMGSSSTLNSQSK